jgi:gliding motility-associated lipoprotein GldB
MKILIPSCIFLLLFLVFLSGCKNEKETCAYQPDISGIELTIQIENLQDDLAAITSKNELVSLINRQPLLLNMFSRQEYPDDSVFFNAIYKRMSNPYIDTLLLETKRVFGNLSAMEKDFQQAFQNMVYYYPGFKPPKIQTCITGLDTDMVITDSVILVSLDYYLGKDAKFRPKMYDYLLRKYDPDDIVPSVMLVYGISDGFNRTNASDKTVLADMIAYGKAYYFAKRMLPCVPDSVLISYTEGEIRGSRKNQDLIWARFVESEVLYSTSHLVKKDYLGERPVTIQVGEKCPGRIGQWVGWEIVKKYMETHPDVSIPQLMSTGDAQKLFKESRYKPAKR